MRTGNPGGLAASLFLSLAALACASPPSASDSAPPAPSSPSHTSAAPPAAAPPAAPPPTSREGGSVSRAPSDDALFVADEDHNAIHVLSLPLDDESKPTTISVPGHPAQLIASRDRVLVTLRDVPEGGGALLVMKRDGALGLNEVARVALPADAWGIALSPDESFVVVSSAFSSKISIVDLATAKVRAALSVGREPRGIAILPDGKRAYVSHLVGSAITRIEGLDSASPAANALDFPAAPLRSPTGQKLPASLGYAVVQSPRGDRLFFPRHALGALGGGGWFGNAAVDVWLPKTDAPLVAPKAPGSPKTKIEILEGSSFTEDLSTSMGGFTQPRAAVYRPKTRTLLVASEGRDSLAEFDASMGDPMFGWVRSYEIDRRENKFYDIATSGGAPSGIALSQDEDLAFVYCRTTDELLAVHLAPGEGRYTIAPPLAVRLLPGSREGADKDDSYALGRSLYYNARDEITSGGLACSACHPDGRDDGHVWHETRFKDEGGTEMTNFMASMELVEHLDQVILGAASGYGCMGSTSFDAVDREGEGKPLHAAGFPRQTPMIAGRVAAGGPYGWHGESADLSARIVAGFGLHRWREGKGTPENKMARALHLAKFLRTGLVPPEKATRALTDEEKKGKAIFESADASCTKCHVPQSGYTDRIPIPLPLGPTRAGFAKEENAAFKTPSLLYIGGTAPYFHDGRYTSLTQLVDENNDKMGKTSHLSPDEKKALVAWLSTL